MRHLAPFRPHLLFFVPRLPDGGFSFSITHHCPHLLTLPLSPPGPNKGLQCDSPNGHRNARTHTHTHTHTKVVGASSGLFFFRPRYLLVGSAVGGQLVCHLVHLLLCSFVVCSFPFLFGVHLYRQASAPRKRVTVVGKDFEVRIVEREYSGAPALHYCGRRIQSPACGSVKPAASSDYGDVRNR